MVAGNQIYSIMIDNIGFSDNYILNMELDFTDDSTHEFDYSVNFNAPIIIDDITYPNIPSEHILDENNYTLFTILLAVDDEDAPEDATIEITDLELDRIPLDLPIGKEVVGMDGPPRGGGDC